MSRQPVKRSVSYGDETLGGVRGLSTSGRRLRVSLNDVTLRVPADFSSFVKQGQLLMSLRQIDVEVR